MTLKYFDISPVIGPRTAVFPGDKKFSRQESLSFKKGDHLVLSSITSTLHIGAHADAPIHYNKRGVTIEKRDLTPYFGKCQVVRVKAKPGMRIFPTDIKDKIKAPRILLRTDSFPNPNKWRNSFNSLSPELIEFLFKKKVNLIGIDTPSIDPWDSKELESHKTVFKRDLSILEGLDLRKVKPGVYFLSALPLRIENADASPVRAVLFKI